MSASTTPLRAARHSLPERTRRCRRAGLATLTVTVLVSGAAHAQLAGTVVVSGAAHAQDEMSAAAQRLRASDLSVLEDLLSDSIQDVINVTVQELNAENRAAQEATPQSGESPEFRYMLQSSGQTQARGMFLEDYGVIFTVQVPRLSYLHSIRTIGPGESTWSVITPGSFVTGALAEEMQLRSQLDRMRAEIDSVTERVGREVAASGAVSDSARQLQAAIAELEAVYTQYASEAERLDSRRQEPGEEARRSAAGAEARTGYRMVSAFDAESMARAEELANQQKLQLEGRVIETVIDTLAHYGTVVRSLGNDDRLAVVLLPSSYLDQMSSWMRATRRAEEFIISVGYGDIEALNNGSIDVDEFSRRIRVEMRLGQPFITPRQ
jgi:hypothetical protein